jgi:hypothetical protein
MLAGLACGSGGSDGASSSASKEDRTPADTAAIRMVDLTQAPEVTTAVQRVGSGGVNARGIDYADVTGDDREEAIVPVESGGTLGNVAYLVFTMKSGAPELVLTRVKDRSAAGLRMSVEDGKLVETTAEYGPEDPLCCPTVMRQTTFRWDGSLLQVEREERVPQTPGPKQ